MWAIQVQVQTMVVLQLEAGESNAGHVSMTTTKPADTGPAYISIIIPI